MTLFTELRHELENYLDSHIVDKVHEAYRFAAHAHKGQQRQSGDPYITHPLAAALILAQMRMDPQCIMAAILHDVIEDTGITKETLAAQFGKEVADLVDGVSKLAQIQFQSRAEAQAESFRKMLLAMSKDIRVILVKLADRLHNMRTLGNLTPEKSRRIALETLGIYAPIANRLGMHAFRIEFEDLGFAALHPFRYRVLQEAVRKARKNRRKMVGQIEGKLQHRLEKCNLPPSAVWARHRHLYSIYKDMRDNRYSFVELMDKYTFCIIADEIDTCYRVLGAVHGLYKPLPEYFRDYIAVPKANGYQALHTMVFGPHGMPIEIQIRTIDMDKRADNGITAYWLTKTTDTDPAHVRARDWLQRLLDIQETTRNPLEFIESVKIDLFPQEVFVFTPKGDILELPRGATPVDLAYAIHSDIGDHCVAAKVDRRLAPLSTPLTNGQTVEIVTKSDARPNPTWLDFVVTGRARSHIRHFLKNQQHSEAVQFGQRLLDSALATLGTDWSQLDAKNVANVLHKFHYKTEEELLEALGLGQQVAAVIAKRLVKTKTASETSHINKDSPLMIKGSEGILIKFADCCYPIPGDDVVGILNAGHGMTIHQKQCHRMTRYLHKHPERCVPVRWEENVEGYFKATLHIEVINQRGLLAQIATAITRSEANIDNVNVDDKGDDHRILHLVISVQNRLHLANVIRKLRSIKRVLRIVRGK